MSSDEIDIEEHDVLDDPRLRHLLPDLARVKTETPDYAHDATTHDAAYEPFATDGHHSGTFGHVVSQGHDDSAEFTRHNNKIILGSKPDSRHVAETVFDCNIAVKQEAPDDYDESSHDSVYILGGEPNNDPDVDTIVKESHSLLGTENSMVTIQNVDFFLDEDKLLEEQIPENAYVALEDWGPKLLNSPCYCQLCKILFSTRNALDAHKMARHSFLVAVESRDNKAYKSTTKNLENLKSCAQCNKKFANDSLLLAHVYGHLASQLNKKSSPQQSQIQNKFSNKISFGSKPSSEVSMPVGSDESSDDGVSGFYRCSVCSYYAVSKSKYLTHNNRNHFLPNPDMQRVDYDYNCHFCSYKNKDVTKFNAHILSRHNNLYTKKIGKKNFNIQPKITEDMSMNTEVKYQCLKCKIILPYYSLAVTHRKSHHPEIKGNLITHLKPEQLKVSTVAAPISPLKRQLPVDLYADASSSNSKKPKLDEVSSRKYIMYYCTACKNVYFGNRFLTLHKTGKCCPQLVKKRAICKTCGLAVASSRHKEFHETNPSATIHDITFIRVQGNIKINAPIPPYYSCKVCKVRALRGADLQGHDCGIAFQTCPFCNKSFLDCAYDIHVEFHKYGQNVSDKTAKTSELPEIMKHYEMLTETWNILYLCSICNIVTDSYDKAVEHSQNHFNNMESYGVTVKKCHFCKLMFDEPCLDRHLEIHNQNSKSVTKDSFKILTYDYTKLLTKEWLELFGTLPKSQIQKIVSRSVYAQCRSVKMSVFLEGAPELTLYQCHKCKLYVYPPMVGTHNDLECMRSDKKFYCDICFIPFCTARGKDAHLITHQNRGTYRHVVFNATEDKDFDLALNTDKDGIPQETVTSLEKTLKENKEKSKSVSHGKSERALFNVFRCIKCGSHVAKKDYSRKHVCDTNKNNIYVCKICGIRMSRKAKRHHVNRHKQNKSLSCDTLNVIKFEVKHNAEGKNSVVFYKNTKEVNETLIKLIRCSCGLHFTASKSYDNHKSICTPKLKSTKCTCSKCGYLFDTNELFRHNCKHHSSDRHVKFVVVQSEDDESDDNEDNNDENDKQFQGGTEELQKYKLYKCGSCKLFFNFKDDIVRHLPTCDPNDKNENKCSRCDIPFHSNTIKHALAVPNCEQLTENDYDISTLYPREMATTTTDEKFDKERCLWKCWKCDLHWAADESLKKYHYKKANHRTTFPIIKCKQCGLNFTAKAIKLHILKHHVNLKLKRQDFHIITVPEDDKTMAEWRSEQYKKPLPIPKKQSMLWNLLNKKVSSGTNITKKVRKCPKCQLNFLSKSSWYVHRTTGVCGKTKGVKCDICGLKFTALTLPNHMKLEHDNPHLKLGKSTVLQHKNTQSSTKNKVILQHKNTQSSTKNKVMSQAEGKNKKSPVDLYSCYKCRLIFLSKTALARHIRINNHEVARITCTACGLTINAQTFFRHRDLHHKTMKLSRKDFRMKTIIPRHERNTGQYENNEIGIEDDDVENPPDTERDKTLGKRNIGDDKRTLYKCPDCPLHFMMSSARRSHSLSCGRKSGNHSVSVARCRICKLSFTKKTLNYHMHLHHKVMRLRREDINILDMDGKTEIEKKNKPIQSSVPFTLTKQAKAQIDVSQYDSRLWKCNDCGKHYLNATTHKTHRVHPTNPVRSCKQIPTVDCSICGLAFTKVSLAKHEYIHHEQMNLQIKDFVIIEDNIQYQHTEELTEKYAFTDKMKSQVDITQYNNQIYYCKQCGLHFMKVSSKQMHVCTSDPVDTDDCSFCGLKFLASTLPKHEYIHHERLNLQLENIEIIQNDDTASINLKKPAPRSATSKVYTLSEKTKAGIDMKLYNNQLFKCARCERHLLTKASRRGHETRCLNNLMNPEDILNCSTCGLTFSAVTMLWHEYIHHVNMKLQLEDFEIVEDEKIHDETLAEMDDSKELDDSRTSKFAFSRRVKEQIDITRYSSTIYKCKCGLHFLTPNSRRTHEPKCYDGKLDPEHSQTLECSICGLKFSPVTLSKHEYIHHEKMNLLRDDLHVITTSKYVHRKIGKKFKGNPENDKPKKVARKSNVQIDDMSKYSNQLYKCTICKKHYLTSRGLANHSFYCDISNKLSGSCPECGLTFHSYTVPKHIVIHHDNLKLKLQDFEIIEKSNDTVEESSDIVEDSNETAVSVSERPSRSLRTRLTTSFYGDDSEGSLNTSRASSVQNLTVDSSMFESNDKEQPERAATPISTRLAAEFKDNKRVHYATAGALKAIDLSVYNNELFKCSKCNLSMMMRKSMQKHLDSNAHTLVRNQLNCDRCDEKFSCKQLVRHIYVHHEKMNLKKEDLKIITADEIQRSLYKCLKCDTHYFEERSLMTHPCGRLHPKCIICDLKFGNLATLNNHYEKHHKKMKLGVGDLIVINTDLSEHADTSNLKESKEMLTNIKQEIETPEDDMSVSQDYDQSSQISEDILRDSPKNIEITSVTSLAQIPLTGDEITKNLATPTGEAKTSSNSNTSKDNSVSEIDSQLNDEPPGLELSTLDISLYDNKLFKCTQCSLHFLAIENFQWHLDNSDHKTVRKIHCTICGLAFSAQTLPTHTFIHHEKLKLGADDFKVIYGMVPEAGPSNPEVNANDSVVTQSSDESITEEQTPVKKSNPTIINITSSDEVVTTKKYTTKLFKCSECNVHFLSQATCCKHMNAHKPFDPFDYIACKICGLQFSNMTFPRHVIMHHKNKEFHLDQVLVEAYQPTKEHGKPKVEIYLAIDKLQSKLVSTTTEKDTTVCSTSEDKNCENIPESTSSIGESEPQTRNSLDVPKTTGLVADASIDIPESASIFPESKAELLTESEKRSDLSSTDEVEMTSQVIPDSVESEAISETEDMDIDEMCSLTKTIQKDIPEHSSLVAKPVQELLTADKKLSRDTSDYVAMSSELGITGDINQDVLESTSVKSDVNKNDEYGLVTEDSMGSLHIPGPTKPDPSLVMVEDKINQDIPSSIVGPETELMTEVVKTLQDIPESTISVTEADLESSLVSEVENTTQNIPESINFVEPDNEPS